MINIENKKNCATRVMSLIYIHESCRWYTYMSHVADTYMSHATYMHIWVMSLIYIHESCLTWQHVSYVATSCCDMIDMLSYESCCHVRHDSCNMSHLVMWDMTHISCLSHHNIMSSQHVLHHVTCLSHHNIMSSQHQALLLRLLLFWKFEVMFYFFIF